MFSLLKQQNIYKELTWIPAHVGTEGNKTVDALAKQALNIDEMHVPLSRSDQNY